MDSDDPLKLAAYAARGFANLQCRECADNIKKALQEVGHAGEEIEIRDADGRRYLVSKSYDEQQTAIGRTGFHVGIRVQGVVFDNLHPEGMLFEQWLADFDSPNGIVVHRIDDF